MNYHQCLQEMYALRRFGIKLGLDVIGCILKGLDHPQRHFRSIHIAGTNGKGSIAAAIDAILQKAGLKVGRYTSPHLVAFNERICVNGRSISNRQVVDAFQAVKSVRHGDREPTFFEIATAMALHEFNRQAVDWAVIETGMGGRFDATNVIQPALAVISNVSLEHKAYLGDSIEKIAFEKSGIIKPRTPVVTAVRQPKAVNVVETVARQHRAPLFRLSRDFRVRRTHGKAFHYYGLNHDWHHLQTSLLGRHQVDNAALALASVELMLEGGLDISLDQIMEGLSSIQWPGRLEIVSTEPTILLDGAHNLAAARHLARYLKTEMHGKPITLIIGILDDKPFGSILATLAPCCHRIVLTRAKIDRALAPQVLKEVIEARDTPIEIIDAVDDAVRRTIQKAACDDVICIAGSLYVVGEAKQILNRLD